MSMFQDITLKWKGADYTVKSDSVMEAIGRIEEFITLDEINRSLNGQGIKRTKLAKAYASVLQYAGAKVTDEEVYEGMFVKGQQNSAISATMTLLAMMVPPNLSGLAEPKGNAPRRVRRAAASSSKRHTKQRSETSGSRQQNSGD